MPISDTNSMYAASVWKRCRDAVAGQRAVHNAGEAYLPKLHGQTPEAYAAYRSRTGYYNASGRTLDGMVGLVFRKTPAHDFPPAMKSVVDDVTLSGTSAAQVAKAILGEVLSVGRAGLLVEFPEVLEQPSNAAVAAAMNLRPYVSQYDAESIINWRCARVNNIYQPVMVLLAETHSAPVDDWTQSDEEQIRELSLIAGEAGHIYRQRVFRKNTDGKWYQVGGDVIPLANGKPLPSIPFVFFGPDANSASVQLPPLADLVDVNLSHYRTNADYEHACHFVGLPTPYATGYTPQDGEAAMAIGSAIFMTFPDVATKVGFLELEGKGLSELRDNLTAKEGQMAALGARMLAPEKAGVEAAATLAMRHNGEQSALAGVAGLVSDGVARALRLVAAWMGVAGTELCTYTLNQDYLPAGLSAQEITALVASWQQGAISHQTLFSALKKGAIVAADATFEDEAALIADEGPTLAMIPPPVVQPVAPPAA